MLKSMYFCLNLVENYKTRLQKGNRVTQCGLEPPTLCIDVIIILYPWLLNSKYIECSFY